MAAADVGDESALTVLYEWAMEQVVGRYVFDDAVVSSTLDYYRFLGHEIIATIIAAPLHAEQWTVIDKLLKRDVVLPSVRRDRHRQSQIYDFRKAASVARTLHGENYRSELLNERHTDGPLGSIMPILRFAAADYLLFLRTRFEDSDSMWMPWSAIFMGGPPRFLVKSRSAEIAEAVARLVGAENVETFRTELHSRATLARQLFDGGHRWDPLAYFERDFIGSKK